jgi:hypothetical protein
MSDIELSERVVETGTTYGDGEPVRIRVRQRGRRYDLDDDGRSVEKSGVAFDRRARDAADRVVRREGFNISRHGVVFVSAVEGRDLASLAARLAESSLDVHSELLELEDRRGP